MIISYITKERGRRTYCTVRPRPTELLCPAIISCGVGVDRTVLINEVHARRMSQCRGHGSLGYREVLDNDTVLNLYARTTAEMEYERKRGVRERSAIGRRLVSSAGGEVSSSMIEGEYKAGQ